MKARQGKLPAYANPPGAIQRFDYSATAELFMSRAKGKTSPAAYRRFETAAEAIRFAIEELPAAVLIGAVLEAQEDRFGHRAIRELYDRKEYPLQRSI